MGAAATAAWTHTDAIEEAEEVEGEEDASDLLEVGAVPGSGLDGRGFFATRSCIPFFVGLVAVADAVAVVAVAVAVAVAVVAVAAAAIEGSGSRTRLLIGEREPLPLPGDRGGPFTRPPSRS